MEETKPIVNVDNLAGYSRRKLKRMNTVHLQGVCPKCQDQPVKFYKDLIFGPSRKTEHNKWYCKKCKRTFRREDLKDVKYV